MKNGLRRFLYALLIAVFISGNLFQGISAGPQPDKAADQAAPEVGHNPETGRVSFIGGATPISIPGASGVRALSAQDKALVAAKLYGPQFGLKNPSQDLTLNKTTNDGNGHAITRYQQVYQGVPVLAGELIFNMTSSGDLLSVSGEISPSLSLNTKPTITGDSAGQTALGAVAKWHKIDASALTLSKPELMIFDESLLKQSTRTPQLVWHLEVDSATSQPIREMVLVDAQTGGISWHINQIDTMGAAKSDPQDLKPAPDSSAAETSSTTSAPADAQVTRGVPISGEPFQNLNSGAATWYVSTTGNDANDCAAISTPCASINEALAKAVAGDTLKVATGTYIFTGTGAPNVVTITKAITLSGGWDETFNSQTNFSVIDGMNVKNGILVNNAGTVFIDRFIIQNSKTQNDGGGIYLSESNLTLQNSTLKSNSATYGGGISLTNSGNLTVINSTISGNSAGIGGGIYIDSGSLTIQNSTIAYNTACTGGGLGQEGGGLIAIHNSILVHNITDNCSITPDCFATISVSDHNILGTTSGCTVTAGTGDQFNVDPLITGLGGTPPMHALQAGSPAINAGDNSTCPAVDERGVTRPQGGTCDIGAYESGTPGAAFAISVSSGSPQTTPATIVFASLLKARVTDSSGIPVNNMTVTFTAPPSGAGGTFAASSTNLTTAVTDNSGIASASVFTANSATGAYTVEATAEGLASSAQFHLQNTAAPVATTIMLSSGSPQSSLINSAFASPLITLVKDQYNNPMPGVIVTFTAPSSGASGTFANTGTNTTSAVTNASGLATASVFTANGTFGAYTMDATTAGIASPVSFHLANMGTTWYVSTSGNDTNDCQTPTTPCATINSAIGKAPAGVTINIASGTYTGTWISIPKNLTIKGGWDTGFTIQNGMSSIDGQNAHGVISVGTNITASIDRFVIENGYYSGGGAGVDNYGNLTITNSSIHDNSTYSNTSCCGGGGGIYSQGSLTISNSSIYNNIAGGDGGGIESSANLVVNNTTISNNKGDDGGGIFVFVGTTSINNSTLVDNQSSSGGGIYNYSGTVSLKNSILENNIGTGYYPPLPGNLQDCYGTITSNGYNIVGRLIGGCTFNPVTGDQTNISVYLAPLANYGGLTWSRAIVRNESAVESGNPLAPGSGGDACEQTDQRGVVRPVDADGNGVARCDIGSFEYSGPGVTPAYIYVYQGSPLSIGIGLLKALVLDGNGSGVPGVTVTFTAPSSGASGTFMNGTNTTTAVTDINGIATSGALTANEIPGSYTVQAMVAGLATPAVFSVSNASIDIKTYTMNHGTAPLPGSYVCDFSQSGCTSGPDVDVNHATQYAFDTYLFYKNHFNRNSIDNADMPIISSVHFGNNYHNAYWNGSQMVYGDGFTADDVVGHELTHGVTDYTSQLLYAYQSGAINESLSDVFGEFVDQTNGSGNDAPNVKWLIGEDLPGGAIRSMSNPPAFGDPDRMTSTNFYTGVGDDGGVHRNSGVNNKAAFLMTDGGSFNGRNVSGIGLDKTAAVYYEVQTNLLGAGANYSDLYYAIHQACLNLIGGAGGITSSDCDQVQSAIDAVEMNVKPSQAYTPYPDFCDAGKGETSTLFSDDMESDPGQWIFAGDNHIATHWGFLSPGIASPTHSMVGLDADMVHDDSSTMTSDITVPSVGRPVLYFKHYFDFDSAYDINGNLVDAYDGGVVEYSANHGYTWNDAGPLLDAGQNYNAILSTDWGNPLGGRWSFSGFSGQMVGSRYNLSSLKGNTVRFRWRIGTDSYVGAAGWYVDDVKIYTCGTGTITGNVGASGVTLSYTDGTAKTATSQSDGSYSLNVSYNWSGTVTPAHACYTFSSLSRTYSNVTADQTAQDYTPTIKPGCANINVTIAGAHQGTYGLPSAGSTRVNYAGVNNGPVQVGSTNSVNIIAAMRDAWASNSVTASFAQLMGLPASQLSDTYMFPAYNNVTLDEQLRIGNVDSSSTIVTVTIGGVVRGTYPLDANQAVRVNYNGLDSGPVVVHASPSVHIIAAIRDAWAPPNSTTTSFVQLMGLPASQLSDTYYFPAYNNVTLNEQLRIGNVDSSSTTVTVTIGGVVQGTYPLDANQSVRVNYAGLNSGPVVVQASPSVHIIAAERDAWTTNGVITSFAQLMGLPAGGLSNTYLFPAYNNVTLDEQLRIGNVDSSATVVTVTIGGVVQGTYPLDTSQSVRVNYSGLNNGPVLVQGSTAAHIIAAERDAWSANGVTTSFVQLMGLPDSQLSATYLFPAYNNVTLDEQLRFGVP